MTLLDANILLYAYDADAPHHAPVERWLQNLLASDEIIGLPWVTLWAFVRVSTNSRLHAKPKTVSEAFSIIRTWLAQPGVVTVDPGPRHARILEDLLNKYGASGPLVTDAVLAALALENGAAIASTDQDFRRFPDVRWINPLQP